MEESDGAMQLACELGSHPAQYECPPTWNGFNAGALSPDFPLGVDLEVFIRREDAERFIEEVRGHDPEVAAKLRIEERELEAGGLN